MFRFLKFGKINPHAFRTEAQAASAVPEVRRDVPQAAARDWWMNWVLKKVS